MKSLSFTTLLTILAFATTLRGSEPMSRSNGDGNSSTLLCGDPSEMRDKTAPVSPAATESLSELEAIHLLDLLNQGDLAALTGIPGIAEQRALRIVAARPLKSLDDLSLLPGFGPATVNAILRHARSL
jgi:DNA uptake protein ComE-like DNA-binding protein